MDLSSFKVSNASTMTSRACCNKSRAKGTYNRFFHGEHMAHRALCSEAMAYDESGTSSRSAAISTPKTMEQRHEGPQFRQERRRDHSWKHILNIDTPWPVVP